MLIVFVLCISSADTEHIVSQLCIYLQHIDQFRQHAKLQQVRTEADDMCDTMLEMVVAGTVPRDIEAIFRKGSDWDVGMDHILILQVGSSNCGPINTRISAVSGACRRFWLPKSSCPKKLALKRAHYLVIHMSAQIVQHFLQMSLPKQCMFL